MKHGVAGRKLSRDSAQRSALLRGLVTELFRHERISTTEAKAKFMRGEAEHLITVAKKGIAEGGNNVHAHRQAAKVITDPDITYRLFHEIAPRFADRPGGYTRIIKIGPRVGDGADMVVIELVEKGNKGDDTSSATPARRTIGSRMRQATDRLRRGREE
jgi:large subunit ribosomal protein L17